ncbi:hypothetical protein BH20ACT2_BH20ACT2_09550 [soil metagenome]
MTDTPPPHATTPPPPPPAPPPPPPASTRPGCNDSVARAVYTDQIRGVGTYYNASGVQRRGTRSRFYYNKAFYDWCGVWVDNLSDRSALGRPHSISTLGTWVNRNDGCRSQHNYGTALDLSGLWWANRTWIADNYESDKRFYMGVAATCNQFFKYSLDWNYNSAHHNHIHFDKSIKPSEFTTNSASQVKFVQASINNVWGEAVTIDGVWGPQTAAAVRRVLDRTGDDGDLTDWQSWQGYCDRTARRGMQGG